jgi:Cu(I)-responsive transcriptional regulator
MLSVMLRLPRIDRHATDGILDQRRILQRIRTMVVTAGPAAGARFGSALAFRNLRRLHFRRGAMTTAAAGGAAMQVFVVVARMMIGHVRLRRMHLESILHLPIIGRSTGKAQAMQIGSAAEASGVSAKMIRHYEAIGLIASGARRTNNYRSYDIRDVHELRFIRSARDLGFSLDEIRALLGLWRDRSRKSADVKALAARHLDDIERRLADLQALAETLRHLVASCHGDKRPDCPILESLGDGRMPSSKPQTSQTPA